MVGRAPGLFFALSLCFGALIPILVLISIHNQKYVIQNDTRFHIVWMQRFVDPQVFPNDYIADYCEATSPLGMKGLYHIAAAAGIRPLIFNRFVPLILALLMSASCFTLSMKIFPSPFGAFLSTVLLNQCAWFREDLATGTPRAFAAPLLVFFLAALSVNHWLALTIAMVLEGLFYPPMLFVSVLTWFLYLLIRKEFSLRSPQAHRFLLACAIASITLIPYALPNRELGSTLTMADAHQMPWFLPDAKNHFFSEPLTYYFTSTHTGFIPRLLPPTLWLAVFFPILYFRKLNITNNVAILLCLVVAAAILFVASHLLLFRLYLPSRYPRYALQIAISICSGIVIAKAFQIGAAAIPASAKWRIPFQFLGICLTILILSAPFLWYRTFPRSQYSVGKQPELYEFFQRQPLDTLIASLSEEIDNLPAFSCRSILTGYRYTQIWHKNYYWTLQHRFSDTIRMQYSRDPNFVREFIRKYNVDFILVDQTWLKKDYLRKQDWASEFAAEVKEAETNRRTSDLFFLRAIPLCTVFESNKSKVLDANCILGSSYGTSDGSHDVR